MDGNFVNDDIPVKQKDALYKLLSSLKGQYNIPSENIITHNEVKEKVIESRGLTFEGQETVCPGPSGQSDFELLHKTLPEDTTESIKKRESYKAAMKRAIKESKKDVTSQTAEDDGEGFFEENDLLDLWDLGINFHNRKLNLRTGKTDVEIKEQEEDSKRLLEVLEGYEEILEVPLGQKFDVNTTGKYPQRYFYPKVVNLGATEARFGYRNRGEYAEIKNTKGIIVPLAKQLYSPTEKPLGNDVTVVGVDIQTEEILLGTFGEFKNNPNARLSRTTRNFVKDIPIDKNGDVYGKVPNNGNAKYGYLQPKTVVIQGDREVNGSLNILFKADGRNRIGSAQGGSFIFESPDKKRRVLFTGTANQLARVFQLFKKEDPYVTVYNIDNGTYALGFQTKNHVLPAEQLEAYDKENSGGGNGLYLKLSTRTTAKTK